MRIGIIVLRAAGKRVGLKYFSINITLLYLTITHCDSITQSINLYYDLSVAYAEVLHVRIISNTYIRDNENFQVDSVTT